MIPLKYNIRNLRVRWKTTLMTMLGTGLVVWSSCILFGLVEGLEHSLKISGDPLDLIVMRKGSVTETTGGFESSKADELLILPGIARDEAGQPARRQGAPEHPDRRARERHDDQHHRSRRSAGVADAAPGLQDRRRQGLRRGRGECIVSRKMSARFKGAQVGGRLEFGPKEKYNVVGIFTAGGSAAESEVWADLKDVEKNTGRDGSVSCVQIRAAGVAERDKLDRDDRRTTLASSWRRSRNRSTSRPRAVGHLPQGRRHADRRAPDLRRHVRLGQHDVRRRQRANPRDRHHARARVFTIRHPDQLPGRVAPALRPGRRCRLAGDDAAQCLDLRNQRLQQLRLDHRVVPLRAAGHGASPS